MSRRESHGVDHARLSIRRLELARRSVLTRCSSGISIRGDNGNPTLSVDSTVLREGIHRTSLYGIPGPRRMESSPRLPVSKALGPAGLPRGADRLPTISRPVSTNSRPVCSTSASQRVSHPPSTDRRRHEQGDLGSRLPVSRTDVFDPRRRPSSTAPDSWRGQVSDDYRPRWAPACRVGPGSARRDPSS